MARLVANLFFALALALGFSTATSAQDINCPEITGDQADQILAQDPSDPNNLDGDNDGFPCEDNPRGGAAAPAAAADGSGGGGGGGGGGRDANAAGSVASVPSTGTGSAVVANGPALALLALAGAFGLAGLRSRTA